MVIKAFAKFKIVITKIQPQYFFSVGLVLLLLFIISYFTIDPDFGWHLQAGRYYLVHGIPNSDIFTYTAQSFPWINHEWLNDYIVAMFFSAGGYKLVAIFFSLIWTLALIIASRKYLSSALILSTVAIIPFTGIRPIAWTVFFIAILERIIDSRNIKHRYWLPPLFLLWANLHGSFVLGLFILSLWKLLVKNKLPWLVVIMSFLAVLINPYGLRIYEEITRTATDFRLRFRISEWKMFILPTLSIIYLIILSAFHIIYNKKPLKALISIPGLLLTMTLSSIRHFPVFTIVSLRYLEQYFINFARLIKKSHLDIFKWAILIVTIGTPVVIMISLSINKFRKIISNNNTYPEKAIAYLNINKCSGNIFNSYNFGGYLIWKLPGQKVYIDGRMPSWKWQGTDYFTNYELVLKNDEFRREEFSKFNIRCVLVNRADESYKIGRAVPFGKQLSNEGWEIINKGSDHNYKLYIQNNK